MYELKIAFSDAKQKEGAYWTSVHFIQATGSRVSESWHNSPHCRLRRKDKFSLSSWPYGQLYLASMLPRLQAIHENFVSGTNFLP